MTVTKMSERVLRTSATSARIAAEIRAEAARQGVSLRDVARAMNVSQAWLSRRVSPTADVDLKVNEIEHIAEALGVPVAQLLLAAGWPSPSPTPRYPNGPGARIRHLRVAA